MAQSVILGLIRRWKWFAYVPAEAQDWLASQMSLKQIAKGKTVYGSGDPATSVYAVVSGLFRIFITSPRGDEVTLEEVAKGGWFPHFVPNEQPTYLGHCICQQDALVAVVSQATLSEFARRWPAYYRGLYHEFTDRAVVVFGRIQLVSLYQLDVRLAVYLLRMARLRGQQEPSGSIWVGAMDSQTEIGARIGGTRQRVNSLLKSWNKKSWIETHRDGVRILNTAALTAEVERSGFDLAQYLSAWHGGWQGMN